MANHKGAGALGVGRGNLRWLQLWLARSPYIRRAAWHVGEFVHRRSVRTGSASLTDLGPRNVGKRHAGQTVPTYPYGAPNRDPVDPQPAEAAANPVLTADDVTDFGAVELVADPFLFVTPEGEWHMFFEVYNDFREPTAAISHATSDDGTEWTYDQVVLEADVHLSFPYVFQWEGTYYMIPDKWSKDPDNPSDVTLYRAEQFPYDWEPVTQLIDLESPYHDCVVFRWEERWWALLGNGDQLVAYYADDLETDEWTPHAANPVVTDRRQAGRPGGRPIVRDDYVLTFLQDSRRGYGNCVRGFRITELTPTTYADTEIQQTPVLQPVSDGMGWNSGFMHHLDPWADDDGTWWCAVDGTIGFGWRIFGGNHWAIGLYQVDPN